MPANLTPAYQAAEERFRKAETIEEKIVALREMLSLIPKHKGTEKLQADIKRRLSKVQQEQEQHRRSGGRRHDPSFVPKEGAGQIALIGPPNTGKSSLLAALTHAEPEIADYPFTTHAPQPGMMQFEDAQVQLIDTPPITHEPFDSLHVNIARNADAVLLLLDPDGAEAIEQAEMLMRFLQRCLIVPEERPVPEELGVAARVMRVHLAVNKVDLDPDGEVTRMLREIIGSDLPFHRVSLAKKEGIEDLREALFRTLRVLRVYAKEPGKNPDMSRPFIVNQGATVIDLARIIHKELAESFRFARLWGSARFDGQPVERDRPLVDRDVVEIHI